MLMSNSSLMPKVFWDWFDGKQSDRDLNDVGVAKIAGISHSVISKARNDMQPIGFESLIKIARAFNDDPVMVLQLAGLLPTEDRGGKRIDARDARWLSFLDGLSNDEKDRVMRIVERIVKEI